MEITIKWNLDSKSDEESKKKVMALLKNAQGTLLPPLPDWDPEELRNEIQDLKLENDRLMQQNKLMIDYIHAVACIESKKSKFFALCPYSNCPYYDHDKGYGNGACKLDSRESIEKEAANIIDKLEDL